MKFYSKIKSAIKLGYRTPNIFRQNIKYKMSNAKTHDIIRSYDKNKKTK